MKDLLDKGAVVQRDMETSAISLSCFGVISPPVKCGAIAYVSIIGGGG